jgi:hypothetical protein
MILLSKSLLAKGLSAKHRCAAAYAIGQALTNLGNDMSQPPMHCHPHTLQLDC